MQKKVYVVGAVTPPSAEADRVSPFRIPHLTPDVSTDILTERIHKDPLSPSSPSIDEAFINSQHPSPSPHQQHIMAQTNPNDIDYTTGGWAKTVIDRPRQVVFDMLTTSPTGPTSTRA